MDPEIFNNQAFFQASTSLTIREGITILLIALLYGLYLRFLYFKFAITFSSKVSFGNTLLIVIVSVASLVAVVKASLALSLGLVGALSVIRFRTAVKEPLNLSFILLAISLAIAIGASQYLFTFLIAVVGIYVFIYLIDLVKVINKIIIQIILILFTSKCQLIFLLMMLKRS